MEYTNSVLSPEHSELDMEHDNAVRSPPHSELGEWWPSRYGAGDYYGDDFKVECPTGSGQELTLNAIADELSQRLIAIFARDSAGRRAVFGRQATFQNDAHWRDYVPFHEYFHGDTGVGVGASHQTGWMGVIAKLIQQQVERAERAGALLSVQSDRAS